MKTVADFEHCAQRLKALADPERLRIVHCLFGGPRNVSDLAEQLDDEIVKVSHHLGILRNAGFVQSEKQGRFVVYTLHPEVATAVSESGQHIDLGCCKLELAGEKLHG